VRISVIQCRDARLAPNGGFGEIELKIWSQLQGRQRAGSDQFANFNALLASDKSIWFATPTNMDTNNARHLHPRHGLSAIVTNPIRALQKYHTLFLVCRASVVLP